MIAIGLIIMLTSASAMTYLAWQNRDVIVQLHFAGHVWTGHLYGALLAGALLACWFMLGASFIRFRIRERRARRRATESSALSERDEFTRTPSAPTGRDRADSDVAALRWHG